MYIRCGGYENWAEKLPVFISAAVEKYGAISRKWKTGDKITVRFKTFIRVENLPDGSNWSAFAKGSFVVAAKTLIEG